MVANNFGADIAGFLLLYPKTTVEDFGGTAVVQAALDRYGEMASQCLSERLWQSIRYPQAELVEREADAGQTTWSLGITPVVAGTIYQFRYGEWPDEMPRPEYGSGLAADEIDPSDYAVDLGTGFTTYTGTAISEGEMIFATYEVDIESPDFAMQSIANAVLYGAAADLGAAIYVQPADPAAGQGRWGLVRRYADIWEKWCEGAAKGMWVPPELRSLDWFMRPVPRGTIGSAMICRG